MNSVRFHALVYVYLGLLLTIQVRFEIPQCEAALTTNLVTDWNAVTESVVRKYGLTTQIATRNYALVHLSIFKTLNAKIANGVSKPAAANYAAHYVLSTLFPNLQSSTFDSVLVHELSLLNLTGISIPKTVALGKKYAVALLKFRSDDGSQAFANFVPAPPGGPPGKYEFTPGQTFALYPQLGTTKPFLISSGADYDTQGGPATLYSAEYNTTLLEVLRYGRDNSSFRTQYQTDTALFWADVPGTAGVSGHWFNITATLLPSSSSLYFISKVYAVLAVAQFDANIAAWYQKYKYLNWRPITAIRAGIDNTWTPLVSTPGHPEYPSGHSATAAPSAYVLAASLGKDVDSVLPAFTIGTEYSGLAARTYTSLKDVVKEGGDSRVFAGLHFRFSVEAGATLGYKVGKKVLEKFSSIGY